MKKFVFLVFGILLALIGNSCSNTQVKQNDKDKASQDTVLSAEDIYKKAVSKVAMIISYKDGIPFSQGSGFFIEENTIITNYHCIEDADNIEFKLSGKDEIYRGAKVVKASCDYDLAIIKTKDSFPFLRIDSLSNEKIGTKIYTIGNPRGLEGTISDGILSGRRLNNDIEYLQITAPISSGNSGGPVLNEKGLVIGVSTFTFKNSQNLNFAVPIKYLTKCTDYHSATSSDASKIKIANEEAISLTYFEKNGSEFYEFLTLRNNTNDDITAIVGVVIYKTMSGEVLDYQIVDEEIMIPVGLAKRIKIRSFDQDQNWMYYKSDGYHDNKFKVEFRLITYEISE